MIYCQPTRCSSRYGMRLAWLPISLLRSPRSSTPRGKREVLFLIEPDDPSTPRGPHSSASAGGLPGSLICRRANRTPSRGRSTWVSLLHAASSSPSMTPRTNPTPTSFVAPPCDSSGRRRGWPAFRHALPSPTDRIASCRGFSRSNTQRSSTCSTPAWRGLAYRLRSVGPRTTSVPRLYAPLVAGMPGMSQKMPTLGLRLARFGYDVDMLASTTWEEAPERLGTWFKQRRRWTKGWIQTLAVLLRDAAATTRNLGPRRTLGVALLLTNLVTGTAPDAVLPRSNSMASGEGRPPDAARSRRGRRGNAGILGDRARRLRNALDRLVRRPPARASSPAQPAGGPALSAVDLRRRMFRSVRLRPPAASLA